jgi:hypothetical protein
VVVGVARGAGGGRAPTAVGEACGANCVRSRWYASGGEDGWAVQAPTGGACVEAAHGRRRRCWREGRGELLWMTEA